MSGRVIISMLRQPYQDPRIKLQEEIEMSTVIDETETLETPVVDDSANDEAVPSVRYDIASYGADYDVEGLVNRLNREDILIPPFQRNYIWSLSEASRFIESLLLGLPVPGVFLAREPESNKLLVIDGQQRLKTLQFFYNGFFNPRPDDQRNLVFKLNNVQEPFDNKTYKELEDKDRIRLNDSLIHATIVKQEAPKDDDTSVYHIFDRLNSEGRRLTPQEIRTAIDHGDFINAIKKLNEYEAWRKIYGKKSPRLKDQELILRFLAFYFEGEKYERPMKEFLNKFTREHRKPTNEFLEASRIEFTNTIDVIFAGIGEKAFRPIGSLNAAVFDSVMVGVARRLDQGKLDNYERLRQAYDKLLGDSEYLSLISQSTSDESGVKTRIQKATESFSAI
ncbi:MAG TPA: DUF262 domain-containing protein [Pyrinomonadaceae bacterium]|nr:DUF262 domain-containing protein [Pyrinomonadaceae bacterium]